MTNKGRRVLLQVTAFDGGMVVVQTSTGASMVLQGEAAAELHAIASDPTQPECRTEANGDVPGRLLSLAELWFKGAADTGEEG